MYRHEADAINTLLVGEDHLLELIFAGAPLTHVLDKLCAALDVQVGNVVSLVLFPDDDRHYMRTIAQDAAQFGLSVFCCAAILSRSEELLGTFEMYGCSPRNPTPGESKLIERATRLAALAIEHYNDELDSGRSSLHWAGHARERSFQKGFPSKN